MKAPAKQIYDLYDVDSPRTFGEDLQAYLLNGYVFATPTEMLMARPVPSGAEPAMINNPWQVFPVERCDTWYIYAYAQTGKTSPLGLVKKLLRYQPFPLRLVAWERKRDGRLRFYSITKLLEILSYEKLRQLEN
jgi:hypothetical protein